MARFLFALVLVLSALSCRADYLIRVMCTGTPYPSTLYDHDIATVDGGGTAYTSDIVIGKPAGATWHYFVGGSGVYCYDYSTNKYRQAVVTHGAADVAGCANGNVAQNCFTGVDVQPVVDKIASMGDGHLMISMVLVGLVCFIAGYRWAARTGDV